MIPKLIIPRSHYDDFMSHVGWWAVMEKPTQLTVNQSFEIEIGDFFKASALCTGIHPPGIALPNVDSHFINWWVITYAKLGPSNDAK